MLDSAANRLPDRIGFLGAAETFNETEPQFDCGACATRSRDIFIPNDSLVFEDRRQFTFYRWVCRVSAPVEKARLLQNGGCRADRRDQAVRGGLFVRQLEHRRILAQVPGARPAGKVNEIKG